MKRWIALLLLVVFTQGVVIDAFDSSCVNEASAAACHTCLCANPYVDQAKDTESSVVVESRQLASVQPALTPRQTVHSLFRPPKTLA